MRPWLAIAAAATFAAALFPLAQQRASADDPLTRTAPVPPAGSAAQTAPAPPKPLDPPALAGVDLVKMALHGDEATAPAAAGRVAHLSIDTALQRAAQKILRASKLPEAAVVVENIANGRVLAWASHVEKGPARDVCAEATAPAASVFKIVTGATLVEVAGLGPDTKQCYSGGENRITPLDLTEDPRRDRWCATLAEAMGRSLNTVFARLALKNVTPTNVTAMAGALGFGDTPAFDVPVAPSAVHIPEDRLGFARTAAGFWNTTLSPFEGATLASTIANHGETVRPIIVESVSDASGTLYQAPDRQVLRHALHASTASALTAMMETTVSGGTSYRAFHDAEGKAFLPNIPVAGKTGTLARAEVERQYTWFVGFAPSRAPEVAIAVLAVNSTTWRVKANVLARDVLRAYFAARGASGVTRP